MRNIFKKPQNVDAIIAQQLTGTHDKILRLEQKVSQLLESNQSLRMQCEVKDANYRKLDIENHNLRADNKHLWERERAAKRTAQENRQANTILIAEIQGQEIELNQQYLN